MQSYLKTSRYELAGGGGVAGGGGSGAGARGNLDRLNPPTEPPPPGRPRNGEMSMGWPLASLGCKPPPMDEKK